MRHAQNLCAIGLTQLEAEVYLTLYASMAHRAEASEIRQQLDRPPSGIYRALANLEVYGFVTSSRIITATLYIARPLSHALVAYAAYQQKQVRDLLAEQITQQIQG